MLNAPVPQLAPMIRARLKERIPSLSDEDLPQHAISETELIERIVRRTGDEPKAVRAILYQVGVFVPPRPASPDAEMPEFQPEGPWRQPHGTAGSSPISTLRDEDQPAPAPIEKPDQRHNVAPEPDESLGSGIPDDTAQSGMMSMD